MQRRLFSHSLLSVLLAWFITWKRPGVWGWGITKWHNLIIQGFPFSFLQRLRHCCLYHYKVCIQIAQCKVVFMSKLRKQISLFHSMTVNYCGSPLINSLLDRRPIPLDDDVWLFFWNVWFVCLFGGVWLHLPWLRSTSSLPPLQWLTGGTFDWRRRRRSWMRGWPVLLPGTAECTPPCRYLQLLPGSGATQARGVPYQTPSRAGGASKHHQPLSRPL